MCVVSAPASSFSASRGVPADTTDAGPYGSYAAQAAGGGASSKRSASSAWIARGAVPAPTEVLHAWARVIVDPGYWHSWYMSSFRVAAGFFALAAKGQVRWERRGTAAYNFTQGTLLLLTLAAAAALTGGIEHGLLGYPDMQIAGNGSSGHLLKWYLDRSAEGLPEIQILSVSLWLYRLLMLGWAIWLALHVIRWSGWAWQQWSRPETWRKIGPLWRRRQSVNPGPTGG